ncbi:MAG: hypothetical protein JW781_08310 [Deltaproteobacteria bacterium]|nr:hypothetical protein [Candidatus Anaeroferrophillacea bacterium]
MMVLVPVLTTVALPALAADTADVPVSVVDGVSPALPLEDDQHNPAVIALADKDLWLVVWEDWRDWGTTGVDIYGRFIDANGAYCGAEFAVCAQPGNQTVPALAYRPTGTVLAVWQDTRGSAEDGGYVYYRAVDVSLLSPAAPGAYVFGAEAKMGFSAIGGDRLVSRRLPGVDYDATRGQFWVAWVESRNAIQRIAEKPFGVSPGYTNWQIGDADYIGFGVVDGAVPAANYADIVRNSSTSTPRLISRAVGAEEDILVFEYFTNINNVVVACDQFAAETLIVWEGVRGRATMTCTFEEHEVDFIVDVDAEGNETVETRPQVEGPSSDDTFFTELELDTWEEDDEDPGHHLYCLFDKHIFQGSVHAQRIDASAGAAHYPAAGFEPVHRKFLVAWETQEENGFSKIYGQLLFSGGGPYGPNRLLSFQDRDYDGVQDPSVAASNQTRPHVAPDVTDQLFFVTWQDGRNTQMTQENVDIYGQFVDCEGSLWGTNYPVSIAPGNQYDPVTAYNYGPHRFFTVWKDARNRYETNSDVYGRAFDMADIQAFDFGRAATLIVIDDVGANTGITPVTVDFPTVTAGTGSLRGVMIRNLSRFDLTVADVAVVGGVFSFTGLAAGDRITSGDNRSFSVGYVPDHGGRFDGALTIRFTGIPTGTGDTGTATDTGTGEETDSGGDAGTTGGDTGTVTEEPVEIVCTLYLSGGADGAYIYHEEDSFTAEGTYALKINSISDTPGRLYVLMMHDPFSAGNVFAVLPDGTIVPFPHESASDWQARFYSTGVPRAREVVLDAVDFRQLGCFTCQGPTLVDPYQLGDIPVQPPIAAAATNAGDFKYLAGDLYVATYVADGTAGVPFDFNRGLVELLKLKIHSLAGTWQVTSTYYGEERVHADLLRVEESHGAVTARWGSYRPAIGYGTGEGYQLEFTLSGYRYVYGIDHLTADRFSGYYRCYYNGTPVDEGLVSGVRVQ